MMRACEALGLNPVRSGSLFLFGLSLGLSAERRGANGERIQSSQYLPSAVRVTGHESLETLPQATFGSIAPDSTILEQTAVLELDSFPLMRHVTLRWDPMDSPLRPVIETELSQRLAEAPSHENMLGGWLVTLGCLMLAFEILGAFAVVLLTLIAH